MLDELEDDATYWRILIVTKEPRAGIWLCVMSRLSRSDLRIELGPELIVSGTIHGDLGRLEQRAVASRIVNYGQSVSFPPQHGEKWRKWKDSG